MSSFFENHEWILAHTVAISIYNQSLATDVSSNIDELQAGMVSSELHFAKCTASATVGNAANRPLLYSNRLHFLIISYTGPIMSSNHCSIRLVRQLRTLFPVWLRDSVLQIYLPEQPATYTGISISQYSLIRFPRVVAPARSIWLRALRSSMRVLSCNTMTRKLVFLKSRWKFYVFLVSVR